jgi:hypothetical protein
MVERDLGDLADADGDISNDGHFGIAYNAALKLCAILLHTLSCPPIANSNHSSRGATQRTSYQDLPEHPGTLIFCTHEHCC